MINNYYICSTYMELVYNNNGHQLNSAVNLKLCGLKEHLIFYAFFNANYTLTSISYTFQCKLYANQHFTQFLL